VAPSDDSSTHSRYLQRVGPARSQAPPPFGPAMLVTQDPLRTSMLHRVIGARLGRSDCPHGRWCDQAEAVSTYFGRRV